MWEVSVFFFRIFIALQLHEVFLSICLWFFHFVFRRKCFTKCTEVLTFVCVFFSFRYISLADFERDAERAWRSRCCKQNQLNSISSSSNSNFLINNSQTNHFISHFFLPPSLSLSHTLTLSGCLWFSFAVSLFLLLLLQFAFASYFDDDVCHTFPLSASNFLAEEIRAARVDSVSAYLPMVFLEVEY